MRKIADGWVFSKADFDSPAAKARGVGTVTLTRDAEATKRWKVLSAEIKESAICPKLNVIGTGETFEEAWDNANREASLQWNIR